MDEIEVKKAKLLNNLLRLAFSEDDADMALTKFRPDLVTFKSRNDFLMKEFGLRLVGCRDGEDEEKREETTYWALLATIMGFKARYQYEPARNK
ncbi:hypothetical protein FACS18949_00970 [Clostridia bacterium]|nr:hypothetical protein FACS18949_00970 [Clostridia bacterium]